MFDSADSLLGELLTGTAAALDIPPTVRAEVEEQYLSIGRYLLDRAEDDQGWDLYTQGSMRLGTVVLPVTSDTQYDLDMVCRRDIHKTATTQAKLKDDVGDALTDYLTDHRGMPGAPNGLKPSRRCWTFVYDDFHLDVLPSVPNPDPGASPTAILLTDKILLHWQHSDPIAYANWFRSQMEQELRERRGRIAAELRKSIEAVPDWQVKTTLQVVVQILKRHRDVFFEGDPDSRTPSILITTLAAHAYKGEQALVDAVLGTVADMPASVERSDGVYRVASPVSEENFADKWREYPERAGRFFAWLEALTADLEAVRKLSGLDRVTTRLSESFGRTPVEKAAKSLGTSLRDVRETGRLAVASTGLLTTTSGTTVRPHTFYGTHDL